MPKHIISGDTYGGDLNGTFMSPTVVKIQSVSAQTLTTKGDVYVYDGSVLKRFSAGTQNQILVTDTSIQEKIKWQSTGSSQISTTTSYIQKTGTTQVSAVAAGFPTYSTISDMSISFSAEGSSGNWLFLFSASGRGDVSGNDLYYTIFNNGVIIENATRNIDFNSGVSSRRIFFGMQTQVYITGLTTANTVDVRFRTNAGTFFVDSRNFVAIKMN
jgi:hypothetical protein